jgi:hypothetical protein
VTAQTWRYADRLEVGGKGPIKGCSHAQQVVERGDRAGAIVRAITEAGGS